MQCTSYLSGHHYPGDQIIVASGSFWPQFDSVVFCRSSRDYNILFQSPSIDQCLGYNKDLLREIMLKHEAIFKHQVYELHRLYGRQRDLMNEIQMKKLSTNCFLSGMQCDISQRALQHTSCQLLSNPRDNEPLAQGVESLQRPSAFVPRNSIQTGSDLYSAEHDFKELKASSSRRNKFGKRLLDLELPAELFMDIDEGEQFEEKKATEIHPVLLDPSIDIANSSQTSNAVSEGTSSNLNFSCRRMSCNFDLNEPVQLDELINSVSSMYSNMSCREIMHQDQDLFGNSRSKSPVPNEIVHSSLEEKGSSFISGLEVSISRKLPRSSDNRAGLGSEVARNYQDFIDSNNQRLFRSSVTNSCSPVSLSNDTNAIGSFNKPREVPIVVQARPCFNTQGLNGTSRTSTGSAGIKVKQEYLCPNLNAACCPSLGSVTSHVSCNTKNQSADEYYCFGRHLKDSDRTKSVVDVNLNVGSSSISPEKEASHEKVEFTDGMVNLDLNVMPSSSLLETEVSQEMIESMGNNCGLENSVGQLNEIGDKPDYDGKIVVSAKLFEPRGSSSQFSALTSINLLSSSSENEDIQNHEMSKFTARVVPSSSSHESETCSKDDTCISTEVGKEISMSETCIDLPSTFGEEKLSQVPTVANGVGTGFEAPDSPDNREHSPPRKESDDSQREKLEDSEDLDRIAAEAIVSILLSGEQQCLKTCFNGPHDASTDCLNWFAGIVSSAADNVENEFEDLLSDAPFGDCDQLAFNALKSFGAMTFESTGTTVECTLPETIDKKNKITGDIRFPSLRRRGRRARNTGKRKQIQAEVAAGSFSSNLTEDIRLIKNLRVATRTVKGRRNVGKTGRTRGKRQSKEAFQNLAGKRRVCSLPKQQHTSESELCFVQSCLFGWGKKSRRQKHRRVQNW